MSRRTNQLTLRDLDPRVLAETERLSRAEGLSLNKAAARLLKQAAGVTDAATSRCVGNRIDRFVRRMSSAEAGCVSRALRWLDKVDEVPRLRRN